MLNPSQANPIQIKWIREIFRNVMRDYSAQVGYEVGPESPEVQNLVAEEIQRNGAAWRDGIEASVVAHSPA